MDAIFSRSILVSLFCAAIHCFFNLIISLPIVMFFENLLLFIFSFYSRDYTEYKKGNVDTLVWMPLTQFSRLTY